MDAETFLQVPTHIQAHVQLCVIGCYTLQENYLTLKEHSANLIHSILEIASD